MKNNSFPARKKHEEGKKKYAATCAAGLFLLLLVLIAVFSAHGIPGKNTSPRAEAAGSTFYISPYGNDANLGTKSQPFLTFKKAFASMKGGDTLLVADGIYTQAFGEWKWSNGVKVPVSVPPSGTSSAYTTVKAENVRGIVNEMDIVGASYVRIEGFKSLKGVSIDGSDHVELKKIAAKGGLQTARSSYVTKEDVWAWNDNRYVIHNYDSDHVIDNRVIARLDQLSAAPTLPVGAISHYLTDYSVIANALLFDVSGTFDQPYDLVYSSRPSVGRDQIWGTIGFNSGDYLGGMYPADGSGSNYEIHNSVIWGSAKRCFRINTSVSDVFKVTNSTCGQTVDNSIVSKNASVEVKNNIFFNTGSISGPISSCDNNVFYNGGSIPAKCSNSSTAKPDIKWLPRSPIPGKGANVESKYAIQEVNGIFQVAENGQKLWPWPYEDLIKQDMCEGVTKGWCGTDKTLTRYVWEYLGTPCPADICSGTPPPPQDTTKPSTPGTPVAAVISSSQIDLSWAASTDNIGVTGYNIYRDGNFIGTRNTNSYSDTGLSPGTTYTYTVSAYDAAGNSSDQSGSASGTTKSDTPPLSGECVKTNVLCVDDTPGSTQEYPAIQAAASVARSGDIVLVHDGNYAGFQVSASGLRAAPIVFRGNGTGVIINADHTSGNGIFIQNASYVTVEGFRIQNVSQRCIAAREASATSPMRGIVIKNNTCNNSGKEGIYLSQTADSLVEKNAIENSGAAKLGKSHGIYLANAGSDNTIIRGNSITNAQGTGSEGLHVNGDISIGGDGLITGVKIEGNRIYSNANNGINLDGVQETAIQNNLVYNNGKHALRAYKIDGGQGPGNLKIINNTFLAKNTGGWAVKISEDLGGHVIFNNILLSSNPSNGSISVNNPAFFSNNNATVDRFSLDNETTKISLSAWQAKGYDKNSFLSAPEELFTNPASSVYELKAGSKAINTGLSSLNSVAAPTMDITRASRPYGSAYDLGAYEYLFADLPDNPPVISNITSAPSVSSVKINWETNEPATSKVEYGLTAAYGSYSPATDVLVVQHVVSITDLLPDTTYHYRVISKDSAGKETLSSDQTFTTLFSYKPSDLNQDKVINVLDFNLLWQDLNQSGRTGMDINKDGITNAADLGIMMGEWSR